MVNIFFTTVSVLGTTQRFGRLKTPPVIKCLKLGTYLYLKITSDFMGQSIHFNKTNLLQ